MASFMCDVSHLSCDGQDQIAGGQHITPVEQRPRVAEMREVLWRVSVRNNENGFLTNSFTGNDYLSSQINQNKVNPFQHPAQDFSVCSDFLTSASRGQSNDWAHFPTSSATLENWFIFPPPIVNGETEATTSASKSSPKSEQTNQKTDTEQVFPHKEESSERTQHEPSDKRDNLLESILASQQSTQSPKTSSWQDTVTDANMNDNIFNPPLSPTPQTNGTPSSPSQKYTPCKTKPFSYLTVGSLMSNGHSKPHVNNFAKQVPPTEVSQELHETSTVMPPQNAGEVILRKPPKAVPRRRVPKNPSQTLPQTQFTPIQSPQTSTCAHTNSAVPAKANQDALQAEESQVYEDILFIGQERCVEDWPEDSPELSPYWKPAGTLKLRRESLRISADLDDTQGDTLGNKSVKAKPKRASFFTSAKLKVSPDNMNGAHSDSLPCGTKKHDVTSEEILSDRDEPNEKTKRNSLKKKKSKLIAPHLRDQEHKDLLAEPHEWSYGEGFNDCKKKEPRKFKVTLPRRRSRVLSEDNLKKMNGYHTMVESKDLLEEPCQHETRNGEAKGMKDKPKEALKFKVVLPRRHSKGGFEDKLKKTNGSQFSPPIPLEKPKGDQLEESCKPNTVNGDSKGIKDCKLKEPLKFTVTLPRRHSKGAFEDDVQMYCGQLEESKGLKDAGVSGAGECLFKEGDNKDDNWSEKDVKPQKLKKCKMLKKKSKAKDRSGFPEDHDPPGATSSNFYFSEAAKAEWMSSQMDVRRAAARDEEEGLEGVQEEDEGDTDSLMEWWNTVELWDEVPSDEEFSHKDEETKSFTEIADKVHRGLRVFYKSFTEQAEVLYQNVLLLYVIGNDVSNFHRRTKIANITGGTTTAVGGVAAIAGLALAPFTLGTSLIISAVGLGVATAGGIAAASATISDNVHEMNDRKKIEVVLQDFEIRLADFRRCLSFVSEGVQRLRCHPLLLRNNYYAGDWEVRRALQTISLVGDPAEHGVEVMDNATVAINSMFTGMDEYFHKDSKEVMKGCKKEVTMRVNLLAKLLQDSLVELNAVREQLMEAIGQV